jgi:ribonuclease P protein component
MPNEFTQGAFVVSRKVGNAVCRNLIKRRLRALFHLRANHLPRASYLWIAKPTISSAGFDIIGLEMDRLSGLAIKALNKGRL